MLRMTRGKILLLALLLLILLSQAPFIYRRYKLGRLYSAIAQIQSQRQAITPNEDFVEFKGVVHVHSFLGGHSTGTFQEMIAGARSNQLDFVMLTEHPAKDFNSAAHSLKGRHADVLFINGNEIKTASGDRLLEFPGTERASMSSERTTQEILKDDPQIKFIAYPEEFTSWGAGDYTGVEVYNVYTDARAINPVVMFFDSLWSYRKYPDLLFATFYRRPDRNLRKWDDEIRSRNKKIVAIAGNDSHSNIGASLNDSSGKTIIGLDVDPYYRSFQLVRVHVLVHKSRSLDEDSLLAAIAVGNCFIGFDLFGDTTGFSFTASDSDEKVIMGDEIKLSDQVRLVARLPVSGRIVLFKDGVAIKDVNGVRELEFVTSEGGSFRVEAYLPQLPQPAAAQPWIISNPIYVRQ